MQRYKIENDLWELKLSYPKFVTSFVYPKIPAGWHDIWYISIVICRCLKLTVQQTSERNCHTVPISALKHFFLMSGEAKIRCNICLPVWTAWTFIWPPNHLKDKGHGCIMFTDQNIHVTSKTFARQVKVEANVIVRTADGAPVLQKWKVWEEKAVGCLFMHIYNADMCQRRNATR